MSKIIAVQYHEKEYGALKRLEKTDKGDWIDLYAAETYDYKAGEEIHISLGVSMRLPAGYEAHIKPRSSAAKRYGILSATSGIIDNSYCGRDDVWFYHAYAFRDGHIQKGDAVCQFRIAENQPSIIFQEELLSRNGRGASLTEILNSANGGAVSVVEVPDTATPMKGETLYVAERNESGDVKHYYVESTGYDEINGSYFRERENPEICHPCALMGKKFFRTKEEARKRLEENEAEAAYIKEKHD